MRWNSARCKVLKQHYIDFLVQNDVIEIFEKHLIKKLWILNLDSLKYY